MNATITNDLINGALFGAGGGILSGFLLGTLILLLLKFLLKKDIGSINRRTLWFFFLPSFLIGTISTPAGIALSIRFPNSNPNNIFIWIAAVALTILTLGPYLAISLEKIYDNCEQRRLAAAEPWDYYETINHTKTRKLIGHGRMILFGGFICACIGSPIGSAIGIMLTKK